MDEKHLIIDYNPTESRVALIENSITHELFVERSSEKGIVGDIYKGKVTRILPGINSAFVDIGLDKAAFLFGGDVVTEEQSRLLRKEIDEVTEEKRGGDFEVPPINKTLKEGQQIYVQVSKEPIGTKGPRITMELTLPGRYLVLMPQLHQVSISRKITDEEERRRLSDLLEEFLPQDCGVIVRTAAVGVEKSLLKEDLISLQQSWNAIEKNKIKASAPCLLHTDLSIIKKTIRDVYSEDIQSVVINNENLFNELRVFLETSIPGSSKKLALYNKDQPIFDEYGIELDIGQALSKNVSLPSGGYLVIEQTEALTSIDINTGRFVGKSNPNDTILKTNIEATKEIVRQLRFRNLGGIIVIDFIDMEIGEHRERVYNTLLEHLESDRARTNVLPISELGLVQMTRKRTADSLERILLTPCTNCQGSGHVRSAETESFDLFREIIRTSVQTKNKDIKVTVRPDVLNWITKKDPELLTTLDVKFGIKVDLKPSGITPDDLKQPAYDISY